MYIKIKNNEIEKYPYYISNLANDNPTVSFPSIMSDELLAEYNVFPVKQTTRPDITYKQNLVEGTPIYLDGEWVQVWEIKDFSEEEINKINEILKFEDYKRESDPLFFKWQRGEATQQDWLDKITEIKSRYN